MRIPSFRRLAAAGAFALFASPVFAEPEKTTAACHGSDMLAEFESNEPTLYKQLIEDARHLENAQALLWRVEKDGGPPSFLFGTVHLSDPRVSNVSDKVNESLLKSKKLAVEVADLSDEAVAKAMVDAATLLVYTDGHTLNAALSEPEFKQVQDLVSKAGMPAELAGALRPWLVNMLLAVSECERKQVASGAAVLDMRLVAEAQKASIPVVGLETIKQQLGALAEVPDDQQIDMLKAGLKYADRTDDMMETLVQLYLKRQMGAAIPFQIAIAAKAGTPASAFDGFQKSLLVDRNARMRDSIKALIEAGPIFVAVGALHLPGKTGLVALLRDAGYTITPVE
jgi:uncharacterized protein YbaP (TraB family)